ncbi:hypothetical protein [aff. Roholtiella sp. LEGE 12411]|uniref:hypothetical protein n=1 Tax=aff. Roholtiella sp. LEGE 12411 TaxID=1828822 RepID=UPI001880476C|nr:hypothetical protein [aff. Roholtiella sp. LEGE 12411]MBE9037356.1 hypothetical protein [aff. Roholtiella sp. LEGE 12411]
MKLIKKSEKLLLNKIKIMEETEDQNLQVDINIQEPTAEEKEELYLENERTNYIPLIDNPVVQSVGNSGWQVSDIWKDVRLDNF